ncbi:MAG: hypothetical protein H6Q11_1295 [Acidobacteria bacterium]|nr:hypothetical protein [Acidobacteriota bacterium]
MKKDDRNLEGLNPEPDGGAGWPGTAAGRRARARLDSRLDAAGLEPAPAPASRLRLALMIGAPALVVLLAVGLPLLLLRGGDAVGPTSGPAATAPTTTVAATTTEPATTTTAVSTGLPEYEFYGMVLDLAGVGPQLCMAVEESLPPQCQGIPVSGLNWADIPWAETAGDTTWAEARLIGTFDGETFAPTRVPEAIDAWPNNVPVPDYTSPCPVPAGGWVVTDPARANQAAMDAVQNYAYEQPGYGGLWVDQLRNGEGGEEADFSAFVLNVTFAGDIAGHEAAIRRMYGGPLCVSRAERSAAELDAILAELPAVLASPEAEAAGIYAQGGAAYYTEVSHAVVIAEVFAVTGDGQAWVDSRFGPGMVELHSVLRPIGTEEATFPLHLYVSNQSTEIDPVAVTINVDGRMVVDQEFEALGLHNWILFELELTPGEHEVRAMAPDAGADMLETFVVEGEQWAVIHFWAWTDPEDGQAPRFTWMIQDQPIYIL